MSSKGPIEVVLGPKYAVRLGELREWHELALHCWGCKRTVRLRPKLVLALLHRRYGTEFAKAMTLKELELRMRCSECGAKACCWIKILQMERNT